jgi:hypothetical protein
VEVFDPASTRVTGLSLKYPPSFWIYIHIYTHTPNNYPKAVRQLRRDEQTLLASNLADWYRVPQTKSPQIRLLKFLFSISPVEQLPSSEVMFRPMYITGDEMSRTW